MSLWDLIGVIAYTQVFALLESVSVLCGLVLLAVILPVCFFRKKFVALGSMIVFMTAAGVMIVHYYMQAFSQWGMKVLLPMVALYVVSVTVLWWLIHRYERLEKALVSFVERLTVLSSAYIVVGVLGVVIVIARNIA